MSATASPTPGPRPKTSVLDIAPYRTKPSRPTPKVADLSANESAFGASQQAIRAYRRAAAALHRYPDGAARGLRQAIAAGHGLEPERIVCGDGSDEILHLVCLAYAGPGDEVVYLEHSFPVYSMAARISGAVPVAVPVSRPDLVCDVDALLAKIGPKTRVLFLTNPGNPSGACLCADDIRRLHAGLPDDVLLVLDAAYAEYVLRDDYDAGDGLARDAANVVMTRTFSKIYGLASLRLGWAYGPVPVIEILNRVRGPYNVSGPAQAAGIAALGDQAFVAHARDHTVLWRARLRDGLTALGFDVPASQGNFLLVPFPGPLSGDGEERAAAAQDFLARRGFLVRPMHAYGLAHCLRFSIGTETENRGLLAAFGDLVDRGMGNGAPAS